MKDLLPFLISWPMAAIVGLVLLRRPLSAVLNRLTSGETGRAKVGPIEIELGKIAEDGKRAVSDLNRLSVVMAETRLLELEITSGMFGQLIGENQNKRMMKHIEELRMLTKKNEKA